LLITGNQFVRPYTLTDSPSLFAPDPSIATFELSAGAYYEIAAKLRAAGYGHVFGTNGVIDITDVGLETAWRPVGAANCTCLARSGWDYCGRMLHETHRSRRQ
jgi:hypothetical protein